MVEGFNGIEHRRYIRLNKEVPLKFKVLSDDKANILTNWIEAKTQNISLGGMCINVIDLSDEIKSMLLSGKHFVEIEMDLTTDGKVKINAQSTYIKVIGRVKWDHNSEIYEMGIQFLDTPLEVMDKIKEFITQKYLDKYKGEK
ncbi:MAG: PilZ domain-containing protein [Candidatus Firestonebacteria bacterium]